MRSITGIRTTSNGSVPFRHCSKAVRFCIAALRCQPAGIQLCYHPQKILIHAGRSLRNTDQSTPGPKTGRSADRRCRAEVHIRDEKPVARSPDQKSTTTVTPGGPRPSPAGPARQNTPRLPSACRNHVRAIAARCASGCSRRRGTASCVRHAPPNGTPSPVAIRR